MKATLIHCYSDHNRGDTGIIYSIHDLAKSCDTDLDIRAMSVFSSLDSRLETDHRHTRKLIAEVYPSFFPEPGFQATSGKAPSNTVKALTFTKYLIINTAIYITKSKRIAKKLLSSSEYQSFENFITSDKVISKGGSFLYSFKGINGALFFARMIYPFYLAKRFNIDCYIYSQSIGPFENKSAKYLFKKIQPHIRKIFLRESKCLQYLDKHSNNIQIISDSAFALETSKPITTKEKRTNKRVAITARPHKFKNKDQEKIYIAAFSKLINHITQKNYEVYLVPQVTGPSKGEDDREVLDILYQNADHKERIRYPSDDLDPREIKSLYGQMDYLVGTRLHSVIFALGMGVPCINIAYHGTKAEGIMGALGLESYVLNIETLTSEELISKFEDLQENTEELSESISNGIKQIKTTLSESMKKLLSSK